MQKRYYIIGFILIVGICLSLVFLFNNKENNLSDAEKFKSEYNMVQEDNVFVYRDQDEIIRIIENGTGVVYLGFPECPWCNYYVKYLNEVAKDVGIEKIYYYNILEDRKNNTETYKQIVSLLYDELQFDDEGNKRIYVPNVSFIIDGKIIGNDYETSKDTNNIKEPSKYWTNDEISDLKKTLKMYMERVYSAIYSCTDCNN